MTKILHWLDFPLAPGSTRPFLTLPWHRKQRTFVLPCVLSSSLSSDWFLCSWAWAGENPHLEPSSHVVAITDFSSVYLKTAFLPPTPPSLPRPPATSLFLTSCSRFLVIASVFLPSFLPKFSCFTFYSCLFFLNFPASFLHFLSFLCFLFFFLFL